MRAEQFMSALDSLPTLERSVFLLHARHELAVTDIGYVPRLDVETVTEALGGALKALMSRLDRPNADSA